MRILIVHEVNYLTKIIYEFQILPEILSILGHQVTIIDYDDSWSHEAGGGLLRVKTRVFPRVHRAYPSASVSLRRPGMIRLPLIARISGAIAAGLEVVRTLRREQPDVILLYGLPTIGLQTVVAGRGFGIPVVFRSIDVTHQLVPSALLVPIAKVLEKLIFNAVDLNIALTPHLKQYIEAYGVPDSRIRLLPSGVDTEMFSPGPRDNELLSQWSMSPEDQVIMFMGTIYRFSGLDRVIADYPKILDSQPRAKLLIVGAGEDESRLRVLAASKGVSSHVVFTGMQSYAVLPALVRSSDVCINPFELNGITENILPTKLFQYMACQKPVLATSLPGTLTFLKGENQGIVYATLDDFNQTLVKLLANESWRGVLGNRALVTAKEYDWRSIARTMADWLGEVVGCPE